MAKKRTPNAAPKQEVVVEVETPVVLTPTEEQVQVDDAPMLDEVAEVSDVTEPIVETVVEEVVPAVVIETVKSEPTMAEVHLQLFRKHLTEYVAAAEAVYISDDVIKRMSVAIVTLTNQIISNGTHLMMDELFKAIVADQHTLLATSNIFKGLTSVNPITRQRVTVFYQAIENIIIAQRKGIVPRVNLAVVRKHVKSDVVVNYLAAKLD